MNTKQDVVAWIGKQGVDTQKFSSAYDSFSVNARLARADSLILAYRISGVPTLIVDGKYQVLGKSYEEMLEIANILIQQVRQAKNSAG